MDDLAERERRSPSSCWTSPYALSIACWRSWRKSPRAWTPPPSERSPAAAAQRAWVRLIAARRSYRHTMRRGIHLPLIDPEPSPTGPLRSAASARSPSAPKPAPSSGRPWTTAAPSGGGSTSGSATASRATTATPRTPSPRASSQRAPAASAASQHRGTNDPARLPAGPREPPQDQKVAGHCRSAASVPVGAPTTADRRKSRGAGPRPATWPRRRRSIRPAVQHRQRQAPPVR